MVKLVFLSLPIQTALIRYFVLRLEPPFIGYVHGIHGKDSALPLCQYFWWL